MSDGVLKPEPPVAASALSAFRRTGDLDLAGRRRTPQPRRRAGGSAPGEGGLQGVLGLGGALRRHDLVDRDRIIIVLAKLHSGSHRVCRRTVLP